MFENEERYQLAEERIREIAEEARGSVADFAADYFVREAGELTLFLDEYNFLQKEAADAPLNVWQKHNHVLYEDILPENYGHSYVNPEYAVSKLGKEYGQLLSMLAYELRSLIAFAYEDRREQMLIRMELFLQVYAMFTMAAQEEEGPDAPSASDIRGALYGYVRDYAEDEMTADRIRMLAPQEDPAAAIVMESDLSDLRYLYRFGEYITENELGTARYLQTLPDEQISRMADTFTEGFRIGFVVSGKDLDSKRCVSIEYHLGFERMIRRAVSNFEAMGKECIIPRALQSLFSIQPQRGYTGAAANRQCSFDHMNDLALILDEFLANRRIEAMRAAYRKEPEGFKVYAGPAVMEAFGEKPFSPRTGSWQPKFSPAQNEMSARFRQAASGEYNEAVIGRNRSFTIISFPLPEIGEAGIHTPYVTISDQTEAYHKIFNAVMELNTLDYHKYQRIQQTLIDTLNLADRLYFKGAGSNKTDLTVNLYKLSDPSKQAIFENCVADVNIPVGEVFTSPVLKGTEGVLHVSGVYLEGLYFRDLTLTFDDGCVTDYSCGNFAGEEHEISKGRAYIEDNILFHHKTLPMGECAIGTNTTAYAAGRKYGITGFYPILIAEKTGPHFAVGDTCYSHEEDNTVFNPDGKEIVAKENDFSRLREKDPSGAYFGCHTDITIPFEELGEVTAITKDGKRMEIIQNGRFVLPGTQELNTALDTL